MIFYRETREENPLKNLAIFAPLAVQELTTDY